MKRIILFIVVVYTYFCVNAQIGYQVSLLHNATGQPRANETVSVKIQITDSKGNIVCDETKTETTNDFGVLSLTVGSNENFADANWGNLPFFISAEVDGVLIGKSQLLSVPVAEYAKESGTLTKEILKSKTWYQYSHNDERDNEFITFSDSTYKITRHDETETIYYSGSYYITGNIVYLKTKRILIYIPKLNRLVNSDSSGPNYYK